MLTIAKQRFITLRTGLAATAAAMALSACGTTNWGFPYRPDIQQGNWITSEQVAQLQEGMTREQVRFILGTPTLQDIFRSNRWDYPYYNKPGYGPEQERKFTVWFEGDSLVRWQGDDQPERQPFQKADTGMDAPASQTANESATAGAPAIQGGRASPDESAQTSPVLPADGSAQPSGAQSAAGADAESGEQPAREATPEPTSQRRPLINAEPARRVTPGAHMPGRSTSEPLR